MNEPETTPPAGPAPTLRTHYLALLTPLVLTHALQSAGGLLMASGSGACWVCTASRRPRRSFPYSSCCCR
jgi:hypothetical protein